MTKIFPHCTISVGLAPLADNIYINIAKIQIIQQTREARFGSQLENATALGLAYPAARSYNTL